MNDETGSKASSTEPPPPLERAHAAKKNESSKEIVSNDGSCTDDNERRVKPLMQTKYAIESRLKRRRKKEFVSGLKARLREENATKEKLQWSHYFLTAKLQEAMQIVHQIDPTWQPESQRITSTALQNTMPGPFSLQLTGSSLTLPNPPFNPIFPVNANPQQGPAQFLPGNNRTMPRFAQPNPLQGSPNGSIAFLPIRLPPDHTSDTFFPQLMALGAAGLPGLSFQAGASPPQAIQHLPLIQQPGNLPFFPSVLYNNSEANPQLLAPDIHEKNEQSLVSQLPADQQPLDLSLEVESMTGQALQSTPEKNEDRLFSATPTELPLQQTFPSTSTVDDISEEDGKIPAVESPPAVEEEGDLGSSDTI